jgi:hypothetical protein
VVDASATPWAKLKVAEFGDTPESGIPLLDIPTATAVPVKG